MDSDISEMISRCEICGVKRLISRKNIATKHIESYRAQERCQAEKVFLSDYLDRNTSQTYLPTTNNNFSKFGYSNLIHIKTKREVLASLKNN